MLLGTYHMDDPGLDEHDVDADDVLAERRQAELRELADRLAAWRPDRIALERPYDRGEELNDRYAEYRSGERSYDREERFPSTHRERNQPASECRSEVVQIGFRLADRLGHERVAAIDEHPDDARYDRDPFEERDVDSARKTGVSPRDVEEAIREWEAELADVSLLEFHRYLNEESELRVSHEDTFDRAIRATGGPFGSPIALASWYDRNVRMVHHLWRTMRPEDDRLLVVVGAGHVRALRHLLRETPTFCPVAPGRCLGEATGTRSEDR
jgi:hypothetical protein